MRYRLKSVVEELPEPIGRFLTVIPFAIRLGSAYPRFAYKVRRTEKFKDKKLACKVLQKLIRMYDFVMDNVPFYQEFYGDHGFASGMVRTLDDWSRLPVVTKSDLQGVALQKRCAVSVKGLKFNTGGTSGAPLEFLLDRQAFAREWAHMHWIWRLHGYRPQQLKLTFRGKHFNRERPIRYNALHNEYVVNASSPMSEVVDAVLRLPRTRTIRWVHGYPSLIAEFAQTLEAQVSSAELNGFRARLYGALLGSEYPAPMYRLVIEQVLTTNVVAWYGHSEMAVLARECARGVYQSLLTYGYAEAVEDNESNHRLVCTSLHNRAHPFIRYDTGDGIEPLGMQGMSLTFRVTEGRIGDFVVDSNGQRHALTAIIFGRHHPAFEILRHLQVRQVCPGRVRLLVVPRDRSVSVEAIWRGLDLDDLDIEWDVELVEEPVRTAAGKIRLKVE